MSRPNLEVVTGAQVGRLHLRRGRVTAVSLRDGRTVRAEREVIVSAGAINTPQLLLCSGIGPADELRRHGISVAADLPGVGENLQDHPFLTVVWESTVPESLADATKPRALAEWALRRRGPLTSSVAEAFAFVRSRPGLPAPDLQFHFAPAYFVDHGAGEFDGHAFTFGPVLVTPRSRGWVRLRSADPQDKPRILTNSLSEPEDVAALVAGVRLARQIAATEPLVAARGMELFPGGGVVDDAELEADARRRVDLLYHPVGTCRIGTDELAVVDPQLRVRGVEGLRVVDASVMPLIPGGNTNAPTIMVAERAADLIRGRVAAAA
jgi:choline dehydrogenase-like flavoprotein